MIAVALKWALLRPDVDPLTGAVTHDERAWGLSDADEAALEWALRLGEMWSLPVRALSAGPVSAAEGLRAALAAGVAEVERVDLDHAAPSRVVAQLLAERLRDATAVLCGDHSADRGSGSVPAFLASALAWTQALGLVGIEPAATAGLLRVTRRIDGGRREILDVSTPAVLSVEGSTARLRRGSLGATIAARTADVVSVAPLRGGELFRFRSGEAFDGVERQLYRPRTRVLPPPQGEHALDRIGELYGGTAARTPGRAIALEPGAAADAILAALRSWGELDR